MIARLLCAGACVLLLGASADAQSGSATGAKTHKNASARPAKKVRTTAPPKAKDPYAAYWNDPGRQAPPFSYFGRGL